MTESPACYGPPRIAVKSAARELAAIAAMLESLVRTNALAPRPGRAELFQHTGGGLPAPVARGGRTPHGATRYRKRRLRARLMIEAD